MNYAMKKKQHYVIVLVSIKYILLTVRFRATINITSVSYTPSLSDRSSPEFIRLAAQFKQAVESEYATLSGQQTVTVLEFRFV